MRSDFAHRRRIIPYTITVAIANLAVTMNGNDFYEAGCGLIKHSGARLMGGRYRRVNRRKFKAYFGVTPAICADIWEMVNPQELISVHARPVHLLWGFMLLKVYATEEVLSGIAGVTEKTFRIWAWKMIRATADVSYSLIHPGRFKDDIGNICKLSVDGTDCPINEPRPFDTAWFTPKFHGPGVRYEVAINIRTGEICWINGPYQCGPWLDGKIFMDGLFKELVRNEMVQVDKGYRGKPRCWTWYDQPAHDERKLASIVRARHETVNARFKNFKALCIAFRHPR